jgi:hypothetical protein
MILEENTGRRLLSLTWKNLYEMALKIRQGESLKFTETITGLDSLAGYTAKAYAYDENYSIIATMTGSIAALVITYEASATVTKLLNPRKYDIETKLYDGSGHVYTPSRTVLIIGKPGKTDPTV